MALIYLPRHSFELDKNPHYIVPLYKAGISNDNYDTKIKPFLEKIPGFYIANGSQLNFPLTIFCVNGVSFSQVLDYMTFKTYQIKVPIQDKKSYLREHFVNSHLDKGLFSSTNRDETIHMNLSINTKKSQKGVITLSRIGNNEKRIITLEDIVYDTKIRFTEKPLTSNEINGIWNR